MRKGKWGGGNKQYLLALTAQITTSLFGHLSASLFPFELVLFRSTCPFSYLLRNRSISHYAKKEKSIPFSNIDTTQSKKVIKRNKRVTNRSRSAFAVKFVLQSFRWRGQRSRRWGCPLPPLETNQVGPALSLQLSLPILANLTAVPAMGEAI